jgi:hypothetical protein
MKNYVDSVEKMGWKIDEGVCRIRVLETLGENVAGGLGLESFFFTIMRGGVCGSVLARVFSLTLLIL